MKLIKFGLTCQYCTNQRKKGTPPKSQHPWGAKVYVCLHKDSTRDAYDKINLFSSKKRKWLCLVPTGQTGRTDRSDRSAPDSQPKNHITSNNCTTLSKYHLDSINRSITHSSTHYTTSSPQKIRIQILL